MSCCIGWIAMLPGAKSRLCRRYLYYRIPSIECCGTAGRGSLRGVVRASKQFIGNASHELQTPLAVLGGRMEYLLDCADLDEETTGEIIQMRRTLDHIVRLNKTLLLLTKIDNGQFPESTDIDLVPLVEERKALYDDIYGEHKIRCRLHLPGTFSVRMDESLCSILVSNLIKNAYLHIADGAAVDIRIEGNVLTVINDGVSPLDEKHIFERFYQGSQKKARQGSVWHWSKP